MTGAQPRLAPVRLLWVLAAFASCGATCQRHEQRHEQATATLDVDAGWHASEALTVDLDRHEAAVTGPVHEVVERWGPPVVVEQPDGGVLVLPGPLASRTTRDTGPAAWQADTRLHVDAGSEAGGSVQAHEEAHREAAVRVDAASRWGPSPLAWAGIALGLGLAAAIALWVAKRAG